MDYSFIGATSSETTPIFEIRSNGGFQFPNYMSFLNNHRLLSPSEEYFDPPVYSTMSSDVLAQRLESVDEPMSVVEPMSAGSVVEPESDVNHDVVMQHVDHTSPSSAPLNVTLTLLQVLSGKVQMGSGMSCCPRSPNKQDNVKIAKVPNATPANSASTASNQTSSITLKMLLLPLSTGLHTD